MTVDLVLMIATAGRAELLERTLESIAACTMPGGYRETIVIENGEPCGTEAKVARFADSINARYLLDPMPNKSNALNAGLRTCGNGFVIFSDDDVRFDTKTLLAYAREAGERGRHFYGGPAGVDYEDEPPEWLKRLLPISARGFDLGPEPLEIARPDFLGFNWAAWAEDVRDTGGFNIERGPGTAQRGQETEMMQRLVDRGFTGRYLPDARVWHYIPRERCSIEWAVDRAGASGRGLGRLARQNRRPRLPRTGYYLAWLPFSFIALLVGRLTGRVDVATRTRVRMRHRLGYLSGMWGKRESTRGSRVS
jgi:GT2 family glycosyltransferase